MTVEWHISDEEHAGLPPLLEAKPPRQPRARNGLIVLFVLLLAAAGFVAGQFWRARQNELLLRAEIADVVRLESQAQAFGLFEEANDIANPTAPFGWRMAYTRLFQTDPDTPAAWHSAYPSLAVWRPPASKPQIDLLSLNDSGTYALVNVIWQERSTVTEKRAYLQVEGEWRRIPWLEPSRTQPEIVQSDHYRLIALPEDIALLDEGRALLDPLESLYSHMDATWAPEYLNRNVVLTVDVQPRELFTLLLNNRPDEITLNSLRSGLADAALPFPPAKQQLVLLTSLAATYRINRIPMRATMGYPPDDGMTYNMVYHLLPQAEAYHFVLDEAEARALRNLWRESLAVAWFSPFESPKRPELIRLPDSGRYYQQWLLSSRLMIDYLYIEHQITPGMLVTEVSRAPHRPLIEHVAALTAIPVDEIEARVRAFAQMAE